MRVYIIQENVSIEEEARSLLPYLSEVCCFESALKAFEDIKKYGKPCLVFIDFTKVVINGSHFIKMVKDYYAYVFIICNESQKEACKQFDVGEEQIIAHGIAQHIRNFADKICNRVQILTHLHEAVDDIKNRIDSIQEKAKSWELKLRMNS